MECLKPEDFIDLLEYNVLPEEVSEHFKLCANCLKSFSEIKEMAYAVSDIKKEEKPDFLSFFEKNESGFSEKNIEYLVYSIKKLQNTVSNLKEVLTETEVKELLQLDDDEFHSIINEIPYSVLCGKKRFIKTSVLEWLSSKNTKKIQKSIPFEKLLREI